MNSKSFCLVTLLCLCVGFFHLNFALSVKDLPENEKVIKYDVNNPQYKFLFLSNNGLDSLEGLNEIPNFNELSYLNLSDNNLKTLPANIFQNLTNLKKLDLSNNQLATLPKKIFYGLTTLRDIELSNNKLTELPPDAFNPKIELEALKIKNNAFTKLPNFNLEIYKGLDTLEFSYHGKELSSGLLIGLQNLKKLLIYSPELTVHKGSFDKLTKLRELAFVSKDLRIEESVFDKLTKLENLLLMSKDLRLPDGIFNKLTLLQGLALFFNNLTMPSGIFNGLKNLKEIKFLKNTENKIGEKNLKKLKDKGVEITTSDITFEKGYNELVAMKDLEPIQEEFDLVESLQSFEKSLKLLIQSLGKIK